MATQDFTIWKDRFEAIDATIDDLLQQSEFTLPEGQPFRGLLERLRAFAQDQFNFFYDGFGAHQTYHLVPSREFHPEYVFKVTLEQVTTDLEFIRRASNQRLSSSETMQQALDTADKLAWLALSPVLGSDGLIQDENIAVISYFEKEPTIRILPYAPVALVGFPLTARLQPRDYLSIAHEIGHYVYRHGRLADGRSIPQVLGWRLLEMGCAQWSRQWKEEIFADVYSCLVAGPLIGLTAQDLARQASITPLLESPKDYRIYGELTEDNGVHPVGAVRPYIYTTVLRAMDLDDVADKLDANWNNIPRVKEVTEFTPHVFNTGYERDSVDIDYARHEVEETAEEVLNLLPNPHSNVWERWSGDPDEQVENVTELYGSFNDRLPDLVAAVNLPSPSFLNLPTEELSTLWANWVEKAQLFPGFPAGQPPRSPVAIEPGRAHKLEYVERDPNYTWIKVLHAGGWATKIGNHGQG